MALVGNAIDQFDNRLNFLQLNRFATRIARHADIGRFAGRPMTGWPGPRLPTIWSTMRKVHSPFACCLFACVLCVSWRVLVPANVVVVVIQEDRGWARKKAPTRAARVRNRSYWTSSRSWYVCHHSCQQLAILWAWKPAESGAWSFARCQPG